MQVETVSVGAQPKETAHGPADNFGRVYAHKATIKEGHRVQADGGFTCIESGAVLDVQCDHTKEGFAALFISCSDGKHSLESQLGDDGELTGLYPV